MTAAPLTTLRDPAREERQARARRQHSERMRRAKAAKAEARRRERAREARRRLNEDIRRAERADARAQRAFYRARGVAEIVATGNALVETTHELIRLLEKRKRMERGS